MGLERQIDIRFEELLRGADIHKEEVEKPLVDAIKRVIKIEICVGLWKKGEGQEYLNKG